MDQVREGVLGWARDVFANALNTKDFTDEQKEQGAQVAAAMVMEDRRITGRSSEMVRACGDTICSICGKKYYDHPMDKECLSYDGRPFLHIGCDGTRLKL